MWIDQETIGKSYVQFLPRDFAKMLHDNGWTNFLSYRVRNGFKFAEVYLFKAVGSDGEIRRLGMAFGYDTENSIFSDNRIIFNESVLGTIAVTDGTTKKFRAKIYPIASDADIYVFLDGTIQSSGAYTIDYESGHIEFAVTPDAGKTLSATYKMAKDTPEPPDRLIFFTYNAVYTEKLASEGSTLLKLGDGDGVRTSWNVPTSPIKPNTLKVYVDSVLVPEDAEAADGYTANYNTGQITFNNPPPPASELTIDYVQIIGSVVFAPLNGAKDGVNSIFTTVHSPIKDVTVYVNNTDVTSTSTIDMNTGQITLTTAPISTDKVEARYTIYQSGPVAQFTEALETDILLKDTFSTTTSEDIMKAVYSSLNFLYPSLPTVISFTKDTFGESWQRDSFFYYWGNVNQNRIMMFLRPDPTGDPANAIFAPLYAGRLHVVSKSQSYMPRKNMVLLGGCKATEEIAWANDKKIGLNKVDYGTATSNGNSSIILSQSLGGSYYQKHYLAFITHDKSVDNGDGKFNPSIYSGKYHLSQIYIVHPNDGYVGKLDDVYAIHPKNIVQLDELEITDTALTELIGIGDGTKTKFIVEHEGDPETLTVTVNCVTVPNTDYTFDTNTKTITFNQSAIPANGAEVLVSYDYSGLYCFTMPTADKTPFRLAGVSPFTPMGLAIFKNKL